MKKNNLGYLREEMKKIGEDNQFRQTASKSYIDILNLTLFFIMLIY